MHPPSGDNGLAILAPPGISGNVCILLFNPSLTTDTSCQHLELFQSLHIRRTPLGPSSYSYFSLPSPQSCNLLNRLLFPRKQPSGHLQLHVTNLDKHLVSQLL